MDMSSGLDLAREALILALIVSGPIMIAGMFVGLVISLFQSMTQVQEQTLSFVPKIVAMVGLSLLLAPWLATKVLEFAVEMFGELPF